MTMTPRDVFLPGSPCNSRTTCTSPNVTSQPRSSTQAKQSGHKLLARQAKLFTAARHLAIALGTTGKSLASPSVAQRPRSSSDMLRLGPYPALVTFVLLVKGPPNIARTPVRHALASVWPSEKRRGQYSKEKGEFRAGTCALQI